MRKMSNLSEIVEKLKRNQVVAYPTEAVFGLGCNPNSEYAVRALLALKNRTEKKGLILIASTKELLLPYIDESRLTSEHWRIFEARREPAVSWVMPVKNGVPRYLTGEFDSIAVRLCRVPAVIELCGKTGFALTSTSANLSGMPPSRSAEEVRAQFGKDFPVLEMQTGGSRNPSEIRDIFTQHIFRQG